MKKIIVAALSVILGAFGYTIVDSAIEDRVANLESSLSSLEAVVESYHNIVEAIYPEDMSFSGLHSMGYNVIGLKDYIYNDDKDPDCLLGDFGYNPVYDSSKDSYAETAKIDFNYDKKQYRFQLWKGQYLSGEIGTVGGSVSFCTKPADATVGDVYFAPDKSDWLKMEMTVLWDEFDNGEYLPQLTRNYGDYWWCNGYVDGQLKDVNNTDAMRILCRITFESVDQAKAFANALKANGFAGVNDFSPEIPNTFKHFEKDVIFLWQ